MLACKQTLRSHIFNMHQKEKHKECPKCGKTFADPYKMRLHIQTSHMNFRPFSCGVCSSSYVAVKDCAMHIAVKHDQWTKERAAKEWRSLVESAHPALIKNEMIKSEEATVKNIVNSNNSTVNTVATQ